MNLVMYCLQGKLAFLKVSATMFFQQQQIVVVGRKLPKKA